jgi:hypothetical protein
MLRWLLRVNCRSDHEIEICRELLSRRRSGAHEEDRDRSRDRERRNDRAHGSDRAIAPVSRRRPLRARQERLARGPALAVVACMQRTLLSTALLFAVPVLFSACASKTPPPKSTTTTQTQTSTTTDTGNNVSTDTKEVSTEKADGSSTVEKTETTKTDAPKP